MSHRIRYAMSQEPLFSKLRGIVEIDESYVGGNDRNRHANKKLGHDGKAVVLGAIERKGQVRLKVVPNATQEHIVPFVIKNISPTSILMSDEYSAYKKMYRVFEHHTVNHLAGEYISGKAGTNTIENFWSLFKRGIYGIYHQVSHKHMQNYLEEFAFRFNNRFCTEAQRFDKMVSLSNERINYKTLISNGQKESKI